MARIPHPSIPHPSIPHPSKGRLTWWMVQLSIAAVVGAFVDHRFRILDRVEQSLQSTRPADPIQQYESVADPPLD